MSHVSDIKCSILSLDALEAAARQCGAELVRGKATYKWFGRFVGDAPLPEGFSVADLGKCEHAIRLPGVAGAYEVGLVTRRDGKPGLTALYDYWQGGYGLEKAMGKGLSKLLVAYDKEVIRRRALAQGKRVLKTEVRPDGWTVVSVGR